jgi:integrase
MAVASSPRKFTSGHFAFMRAVVQGIDLRASWDRYLRTEGEFEDLRKVRSTIARMRSEFAAAARRQARPGTARLMLVKAGEVHETPGLPSLAAFAEERGLNDFTEREQQAAFVEAYGPGTDAERRSRRARLIHRQLEALQWLERLVAQDPGPDDGVAAWFAPSIASRLEKAKLRTVADLVGRINGVGARWWTVVPAVGELKASRILDWLRLYEPSIGIRIGSHVAVRRTELQPAQLDKVVAKATAIVPFEKFLLPAELDGSDGRFRAPLHQCLLEAKNDYEAIAAWLATKHDPNGTGKTATHRAYRKEAERLLLWAIVEHGKPLSSLTVEDVNAFKWFLAAPPARWCGPRHHQRWSPLWRPLEGPLSSAALRQSIVILRSLMAFLVSQNYLIGNAFAGVALPRETGRVLGSRRTLTFNQWDAIEERLEAIGYDALGRRRARAVRWLYATGLRLSEMANAQCGDLREVDYWLPEGKMDTGWMLSVVGKGDKLREVPVPASLVEELQEELERHGLEPGVQAESNQDISILVRFEEGHAQPWSMSGLAKGIKALLTDIATDLEPDDAKQLRKASTHWLRHSHGSHALNGRPGETGVPIQVVQNNLGHASIGTTSGYLTTERDMRLAAMKGFGDSASRRAGRKT